MRSQTARRWPARRHGPVSDDDQGANICRGCSVPAALPGPRPRLLARSSCSSWRIWAINRSASGLIITGSPRSSGPIFRPRTCAATPTHRARCSNVAIPAASTSWPAAPRRPAPATCSHPALTAPARARCRSWAASSGWPGRDTPEPSAPPARRPHRARHSKNPAPGRSASPVCHRPPTTPVSITSITAPRGSVVQARSRPSGCHRPVTGPEEEAQPPRGAPSRSSLAVIQMRQPRGRQPAASVGGHPAGRSRSRAENAQNWLACAPPPAQPARLPAAPIRRSGAAPPCESLTVSDPVPASAARASPPICTISTLRSPIISGAQTDSSVQTQKLWRLFAALESARCARMRQRCSSSPSLSTDGRSRTQSVRACLCR
jgi:hypothetical protein